MKQFTTVLAITLGLFGAAISAPALEVGDTAPNMVLMQIQPNGTDSQHGILDSAKGPVLLDFFSTTCSYCVRDMPKVAAFAEEISGVATVRIIGLDRDESRIRAYHSANRELFTGMDMAIDKGREVSRAFVIEATPTYFLIDAQGKIVFKNVGTLEDAELAQIRALLGAGN